MGIAPYEIEETDCSSSRQEGMGAALPIMEVTNLEVEEELSKRFRWR